MDGEVVRQPDLPRDGAGGLLGHGHEDVGGGGVGPALEQAGQQEVPLLPSDQLVVVVGALAARQQLLGLELDQNGGHQQELGELVEVDLVPLLGQDPDEPVDDGQQRDVEHVDLVGGDQVQQEVDRAFEGGRGDRERHPATLPNLPHRAAHPPKVPAHVVRSAVAADVPWRPMKRVLSGIAPSGDFTLGNYLGALRHWVTFQDDHDAFYCVVDLHALTNEIDPAVLRRNTLDAALNLLAVGLDPERCTIFVQSHVPEHTRLTWLLECTATMGELRRMTQYKEKSEGNETVRAGLFTYPVLMAADILLYAADAVPVGDDQRQHLELARELAVRFNNRYGETFTVPEAAIPRAAARVMDLQHPERKMSKSVESPLGTIGLLDSAEEITRKVARR